MSSLPLNVGRAVAITQTSLFVIPKLQNIAQLTNYSSFPIWYFVQKTSISLLRKRMWSWLVAVTSGEVPSRGPQTPTPALDLDHSLPPRRPSDTTTSATKDRDQRLEKATSYFTSVWSKCLEGVITYLVSGISSVICFLRVSLNAALAIFLQKFVDFEHQ